MCCCRGNALTRSGLSAGRDTIVTGTAARARWLGVIFEGGRHENTIDPEDIRNGGGDPRVVYVRVQCEEVFVGHGLTRGRPQYGASSDKDGQKMFHMGARASSEKILYCLTGCEGRRRAISNVSGVCRESQFFIASLVDITFIRTARWKSVYQYSICQTIFICFSTGIYIYINPMSDRGRNHNFS